MILQIKNIFQIKIQGIWNKIYISYYYKPYIIIYFYL